MVVKRVKKQRRIWVTDEISRELQAESGFTPQGVLNALKFGSYSEEAKRIRKSAIRLMSETQDANKKLMKEFHD